MENQSEPLRSRGGDTMEQKDQRDFLDVEKYGLACELISKNVANSFMDTYPRGKTLFRDLLYEKMGCSLLEAEELVDALERNRKIEFIPFPKRKRFGTWEIR
jgi:hypothetical protein